MNFVSKCKGFWKEHWLISLIVFLFIITKLAFMLRFHNIIWDEAVYLSMAKYIYSHGQIGFWEIVRPIGLPLVIGLFWKLGMNIIQAAEILAIAFSTGMLILIYAIGKEVFTKKVGIFAAFFAAITSVFFLYTNFILTGIPSTFFILLGVYYYIKKRNLIAAGIFTGIGSLFRFPQGIIIFAFIAFFLIQAWTKKEKIVAISKQAALYLTFFVAIHIPFLIFNYVKYHLETTKISHAIFRPWILGYWAQSNPAESVLAGTIGSTLYNIFFYAINALRENTLLIFVLAGLYFYVKKKGWLDKRRTLLLLIMIIYLGYFTFISNKQVRFMVVFLPYLAIFAAYGFTKLFKAVKRKDRYRIILVIFLTISVYGVVARDMNYYSWRPPEEPDIVKNYYKFFEGREIKGPIMTTDPVPAAYVDAEFRPFFFSVYEGWWLYQQYRNSSYAVIYSPESFFCAETDKPCREKLDIMTETIEKENRLLFSEIYGDRAYYIYEVI